MQKNATMDETEVNIIFFEMDKSPAGGEVVVVSQATFNNHTGLDVRCHYRRKDKTFNRSKKGLRLSPEGWKTLIPEIQKAITVMEANP